MHSLNIETLTKYTTSRWSIRLVLAKCRNCWRGETLVEQVANQRERTRTALYSRVAAVTLARITTLRMVVLLPHATVIIVS
jgi:predicted site-specific integrase-resolvase